MEKEKLTIIEEPLDNDEVEIVETPRVRGSKAQPKKSMLSRIITLTVGTINFDYIGDQVIEQIIKPHIKQLVSSSLKSIVDYVIFETPIVGQGGPVKTSSNGKTNYSGFSGNNGSRPFKQGKALYSPGECDIVFNTRDEAMYVYNQALKEFDYRTLLRVSDLYEISNVPISPTDNRYGWTNLNEHNLYVTQEGGQWVLHTPVAKPLR